MSRFGKSAPAFGRVWTLEPVRITKEELQEEWEAKKKLEQGNSYCWSTKDVESELGVHGKTVDRWRARQGLPSKKFGRTVKFRPSDVRRWAAQRKEG